MARPERQRAPKDRDDAPCISLLMPVLNPPADALEAAISSVVGQSYARWELCICDDGSTQKTSLAALERWRGVDPRLKITRSEGDRGVSGATNCAAEFATGEFVGFLDQGDALAPDALEEMAAACVQHPTADVLYSDEDTIKPDGSRSEPLLKPDWSPEHLLSTPYILHLMLVRKSLFLALGGLRSVFDGAQDYDLSLRATAAARDVVHVPKVLYHCRKDSASAAADAAARPQALVNAQAAVRAFVKARDPKGEVVEGLLPGASRVIWFVEPARPVTLLMLAGGRRRKIQGRRSPILLCENAARSILSRSTFPNFQLLILEDGNLDADVMASLRADGVRLERYDRGTHPFNYPDKLNAGLAMVETEDVIILNDDIEVISPDWMEALLSYSRQDDIGVVGARLLYPGGRIQHAGIVTDVVGPTVHIFHNQRSDEVAYNGYTHVVRNYSAVTGAVMATKMCLIRELGGYDPGLAIDYNDVDFCLKLRASGRRVVWTPFATLTHFEGSSLARRAVSPEDEAAFLRRWGDSLADDPFYNPGLPRGRTDCHVESW